MSTTVSGGGGRADDSMHKEFLSCLRDSTEAMKLAVVSRTTGAAAGGMGTAAEVKSDGSRVLLNNWLTRVVRDEDLPATGLRKDWISVAIDSNAC